MFKSQYELSLPFLMKRILFLLAIFTYRKLIKIKLFADKILRCAHTDIHDLPSVEVGNHTKRSLMGAAKEKQTDIDSLLQDYRRLSTGQFLCRAQGVVGKYWKVSKSKCQMIFFMEKIYCY